MRGRNRGNDREREREREAGFRGRELPTALPAPDAAATVKPALLCSDLHSQPRSSFLATKAPGRSFSLPPSSLGSTRCAWWPDRRELQQQQQHERLVAGAYEVTRTRKRIRIGALCF